MLPSFTVIILLDYFLFHLFDFKIIQIIYIGMTLSDDIAEMRGEMIT